MGSTADFPTVDLSLLLHEDPKTKSQAIQQFHRICQDYGFFLVTNHGISESIIRDAMDVNSEFFDMPLEKREELISYDLFKPVRLGEVKGEVGDGQFFRRYLKLFSNPIEDFIDMWPKNPPDYREKMAKYTLLIRKVGIVLFASMMEGLGLGSSYKQQEFEQGVHIMGINSYPPSSESKMKMGIPHHTDHGFMTILLQNTPGLQVLDRTDGQWKAVPDAECSVVVLLADYTEVLSNGIYKSLTHRAYPRSKETRVIIGAWNLFGMDEVVEPAPELLSETQPSKYKGSSLRDYINHIDSKDPKRFLETLRL